jgi:hypothetical protein
MPRDGLPILREYVVPPGHDVWRIPFMRQLTASFITEDTLPNLDDGPCVVDMHIGGITFHECDQHNYILYPKELG